MQSPTQPEPAEGPREDESSATKSGGQGVSATDPPKAPTMRPTAEKDPPPADAAGAVGERMVTLAAIAGAHGLGGEVRLKLFTDDLAPYRELEAGSRRLTLTAVRGIIVRFAEITDRTMAEGLRGTLLRVPRAALPPLGEGEYYHADLIGLPAVSTVGELLGEVVAVENFGAVM